MDKTKIILIGIIILLVSSIAIYFAYQKVNTNFNEKLYNQTQLSYQQGAYDIIYKINQDGNIPIIQIQDNKTTITYKSINEICGVKQ